jgi:hypothetical protein
MTGRLHGTEQFLLIGPVIRAVAVRLAHAQIHYSDYLSLFDKRFTDHLGEFEAVELLFGGDGTDEVGANNSFFIRAEAYVYASLQALHAIADNMAHVVYYALGWNLDQRLSLGAVSFHKVLEQLSLATGNGEPLTQVAAAFEALKTDPDFKALENATNHIKHHGGLPVSVGLTGEHGEAVEARLMEYQRRSTTQASEPVLMRMERSHASLGKFVLNAGKALNEVLQQRLSSRS